MCVKCRVGECGSVQMTVFDRNWVIQSKNSINKMEMCQLNTKTVTYINTSVGHGGKGFLHESVYHLCA